MGLNRRDINKAIEILENNKFIKLPSGKVVTEWELTEEGIQFMRDRKIEKEKNNQPIMSAIRRNVEELKELMGDTYKADTIENITEQFIKNQLK